MATNVGSVEIDVHADASPARRETKEACAEMSKTNSVNVKMKLDKSVGSQVKSLTGAMDDNKEATGGTNLAWGFIGTTWKESRNIILALTPSILGLNNAIIGAGAGIVALTGNLLQASGSIVNVANAVGALGQGFLAVKIGSMGVADAFKAQAKAQEELAKTGEVSESTQQALDAAMKGLTPSAREAVTAITSLRDEWNTLQDSVQEALFKGVGDSIKELANNLLPTLQSQLTASAGIVNEFATNLAAGLSTPQAAGTLAQLMTNFNTILENLLKTIAPLGSALATIFLAAGPTSISFSETLVDLANNFNDFIQAADQAGDLDKFFQDASTFAGQFIDILASLGDALFTVFAAGQDEGAGLLTTLQDAAANMADFLKSAEGQDALQGFFAMIDTIGPTMQNLWAIAGPVLEALFRAFEVLGPAIDSVRSTLQPVAEMLGQALGEAIDTLGPKIASLMEALGPFLAALGVVLVNVIKQLVPVVGLLIDILTIVAKVISAVLAPVITFLAPVIAFIITLFIGWWAKVALFAKAGEFFVPLFAKLGEFSGILGKVGGFFAKLWDVVSSVFSRIGTKIEDVVVKIGAKLESLGGIFGSVAKFVVNLWLAISSNLAAAFTAVAAFVAKVIGSFTDWKNKVSDIVSDVIGFFKELPGKITAALGNIGQEIGHKFEGIVDFVKGIPGQIVSAFSGLAGKVLSAIGTIDIGKLIKIPSPGGGVPFVPGIASGGAVTSPTLAMIGEAGPELVVPARRGASWPTGMEEALVGLLGRRGIGATSGGNTAEINVMLPTGDPQAAALAIMDRLSVVGFIGE